MLYMTLVSIAYLSELDLQIVDVVRRLHFWSHQLVYIIIGCRVYSPATLSKYVRMSSRHLYHRRFDGMMAVEGNMRSPLGDIYNGRGFLSN